MRQTQISIRAEQLKMGLAAKATRRWKRPSGGLTKGTVVRLAASKKTGDSGCSTWHARATWFTCGQYSGPTSEFAHDVVGRGKTPAGDQASAVRRKGGEARPGQKKHTNKAPQEKATRPRLPFTASIRVKIRTCPSLTCPYSTPNRNCSSSASSLFQQSHRQHNHIGFGDTQHRNRWRGIGQLRRI